MEGFFKKILFKIILLSLLGACSDNQKIFLPDYTEIDYLIKNGKIVDGTGNEASLPVPSTIFPFFIR